MKVGGSAHPKELVSLYGTAGNAVDADAVEKLIFLGERLPSAYSRSGTAYILPLNQAAGTIFLTGIGAGAAVAGVAAPVTFGKGRRRCTFHRPGRTHPPARHLPDNHVSQKNSAPLL